MNNVKDLIRDSIDELDLTRASVAKSLGISVQHFNNIMNQDAKMPVKYFHKIADYLIIDDDTLRQAFKEDYMEELDIKIKCWGER